MKVQKQSRKATTLALLTSAILSSSPALGGEFANLCEQEGLPQAQRTTIDLLRELVTQHPGKLASCEATEAHWQKQTSLIPAKHSFAPGDFKNRLRDLTPLLKLPKLEQVTLNRYFAGAEIGALAQLPRLKHLSLSTPQVFNLAPFQKAKQLRQISLFNDGGAQEIEQTLATAPILPQIKAVQANTGGDLSGLAKFPALSHLEISQQESKALNSVPSSLPLQDLKISHSGESAVDLSQVNAFPGLLSLRISGHESLVIQQPAKLSQLKHLKELSAEYLPAAAIDFSSLPEGGALEQISLIGTPVENIEFLKVAGMLKAVSVSDHSMRGRGILKSLRGLENKPFLASIEIRKQPISDLAPLAADLGLETVVATDCDLDSISALAGHAKLRELDITRNQVASIEELRESKALATLRASGNQILSANVLAELPGIK